MWPQLQEEKMEVSTSGLTSPAILEYRLGNPWLDRSGNFLPFIPHSFLTYCVLIQYVCFPSPPPSPSTFLGEVHFSNLWLCPWPVECKWACCTKSLSALLLLGSLFGTSGFHCEKYKPGVDHSFQEEHTNVGQNDHGRTPQPSLCPPVSPQLNCSCVGVPLWRPGEPSASVDVLFSHRCVS